VGFVVDKVALGQVFSSTFRFPCQSSFHQFLHNHHHLSSGASTIGQYWPQYTKSQGTNKKKRPRSERRTRGRNRRKKKRKKTRIRKKEEEDGGEGE
jgi:hypothetical protein